MILVSGGSVVIATPSSFLPGSNLGFLMTPHLQIFMGTMFTGSTRGGGASDKFKQF